LIINFCFYLFIIDSVEKQVQEIGRKTNLKLNNNNNLNSNNNNVILYSDFINSSHESNAMSSEKRIGFNNLYNFDQNGNDINNDLLKVEFQIPLARASKLDNSNSNNNTPLRLSKFEVTNNNNNSITSKNNTANNNSNNILLRNSGNNNASYNNNINNNSNNNSNNTISKRGGLEKSSEWNFNKSNCNSGSNRNIIISKKFSNSGYRRNDEKKLKDLEIIEKEQKVNKLKSMLMIIVK
jgi:hypothetical protein